MDTRSIQLAKYKPWKITEYDLIFRPIRPRFGPLGYKTFFMLNSTEHEIDSAHKC